MATPKFIGVIRDGKPRLHNMGKYRAYLQSFAEETPIELTLKKYKPRRTDPQNKYYWGVVVPMLADNFGYTKDEMHDALKWLFLRKPEAEPPTVGSTAKLDTKGFNEYIEKIQIYAASEHSVVIPDPDEAE